MVSIIAIITLCILLITKEVIGFYERREQMDRLMAKSLPEYKDNTQTEDKPTKPEPETVVELDEAKNDIYGESDE